jgi:hypothetical protein
MMPVAKEAVHQPAQDADREADGAAGEHATGALAHCPHGRHDDHIDQCRDAADGQVDVAGEHHIGLPDGHQDQRQERGEVRPQYVPLEQVGLQVGVDADQHDQRQRRHQPGLLAKDRERSVHAASP